jgi:transcriptional regulator with XRE-family HTH domain
VKEPTNRLSATLRQLRRSAGLSGTRAAARAGVSQKRVSRVEIGTFMPTPEEVETLCRIYEAPAQTRRELVQMAQELREDRISARLVLERGGWWLQERIGRIEEVAGRIRCIAPTVVPGLLQTREYARALFADSLAPGDLERTVEARMARQRLLETDRTFAFILSEGTLRWNMGGPRVMVDQLAALRHASERENVQFGIVSWTTAVTVPVMHSIDIYDSRAVMFGTISATALITSPREVEEYEDHWSELAPFASCGEQARAALNRIEAEYRTIA